MPVKYPDKCRDATAGQLREISRQGYSEDGQFVRMDVAMAAFASNPNALFNKCEPGGKYMETLQQTKAQLDATTDALAASSRKLVATAKEANAGMTDASRGMRDNIDKLGAAIEKFNKLTGSRDFTETVKHAEALVSAMERLAVLEEKGVLDRVFAALQK